VKDFFLARFVEFGGKNVVELQGEVGTFHGATSSKLGSVGSFECDEKILLTGCSVSGDGSVVEKRFGDEVEGVTEVGEDDGMSESGVE